MVSGNVWQGEYCAVLVTRVQEIEWPIIAQLENIDKQALALFLSPISIAAVCGVTLLAIVVLLAQRISRPLESTARDSKEIVKNIGGDLSKMEHSGGEDDVVEHFVVHVHLTLPDEDDAAIDALARLQLQPIRSACQVTQLLHVRLWHGAALHLVSHQLKPSLHGRG